MDASSAKIPDGASRDILSSDNEEQRVYFAALDSFR